jgi:hypothetical protein
MSVIACLLSDPGSVEPVAMSHVDSLYEDIAHFSVTDLATLQTDAQMVAYELAVCFGQPVRDVSVLISDVQTYWETVAR